MKFMPGLGTCLVAISSLTDLELLASMPKKVVIQVSETHPTKWTTLRAYIVEDVKFYELYDMIADKMKGPAFSPEELGVA
jgi:hypothetical protein